MAVTVSELQARLSVDSFSKAKFGRDMAAADRTMENTSRTGQRHFGTLGRGIAKAGVIGVGAAASIGAAFAGMVIYKGGQRAIAIDDANRKLEGLGYTAQQVAGITDDALKSVLGTPYSLAEALTVASTALAAGIEPGQQLSRYLGEVADTATIAGSSLQDVGGILNGVIATQRVYTDDLNQLSNRGLPVFSWLQDQYDVTGEKLAQMVADGKVKANDLLKVIRDNIGGAAQKAGEGIRGSFANLMTAVARLGDAFLGPAFGSVPKFFKTLRDEIDKATVAIAPLGEAFGGFVETLSKQKTWSLRIRTVLTGAGSLLEKILFGSPATRIRVPIEGGRFEWQVKGGGTGLVGAVADAIREIDWVHVGVLMVKGFKSGLEQGITAAGFDPNKGLLGQVWPNAFGWTGIDIPKGPSGWDLIKRAFGGLEDDANAATGTVTTFQKNTSNNLKIAGQNVASFAIAAAKDFGRVSDDTDHSSDSVETLRGQIDKLHSKTVKVTADVSGLSTTAALAEHLAFINRNRNINVNIEGPSGDGLIGVGGVSAADISPTLFDDLGLAQAFGLSLSSGYRPGAVTLTGNPSLHGVYPSKAIDVAGSESAMSAFFRSEVGRAPFTGIRELIHNPYAWYPGAGLVNIAGTQLGRDHINHVHVGSYDQGGFLRPGWNLAYNGLGRNEPVGGGGTYVLNAPNYVGSKQELLRAWMEAATEFRRRGGTMP